MKFHLHAVAEGGVLRSTFLIFSPSFSYSMEGGIPPLQDMVAYHWKKYLQGEWQEAEKQFWTEALEKQSNPSPFQKRLLFAAGPLREH